MSNANRPSLISGDELPDFLNLESDQNQNFNQSFNFQTSPQTSLPSVSKAKPIRPTLITGFTNGYNFSNNFINSPRDQTLKKSGTTISDLAIPASSDASTPITLLNKGISRIAEQNVVDAPPSPMAMDFAQESDYRTQPNSFSEVYIDTRNLGNFDIDSENSNIPSIIPRSPDELASSLPSLPYSTLLERDFPAEILPFELLEKIDGSYIINSEKSQKLPNNNYGSLYHDNQFDDIINPLQETRMFKMRDSSRLGQLKEPETRTRPRTYSESETANFSTVTGERLYDDDKHRPISSLHGHHEKLRNDSIHSRSNSRQSHQKHKQKQKQQQQQNIYSTLDIDSLTNTPYLSRQGSDMDLPTNITLHGGTIVPDANYKPNFMSRRNYNKNFGLAKTHQISTSTLELLKPQQEKQLQSKLHPNVDIYNNFESLLGCEDEYIPGLDFENSIGQWFDDDDDYNRYFKLQVILSHYHDPKSDSTDIENVDSQVLLEVPSHKDNNVLSEAPHDYTFKEINSAKKEESDIEKKEVNVDSLKPLNSNLMNYKKSILNFNDYDYNNLFGGHKKLNKIPQYILDQKEKSSPESPTKNNDIFSKVKSVPASPQTKTLSSTALARASEYNLDLPQVSKLSYKDKSHHVKFEFGTVIDKSTSGTSSLSTSPSVITDVKTKLIETSAKEANKTAVVANEKGEEQEDHALDTKKNAEKCEKGHQVPIRNVEEQQNTQQKASDDVTEQKREPKKVNYEELIDKLPDDFLELPFSKRRKVLLSVLPPNDEHNKIDSKLLLQLIKNKFSNKEEPQKNSQSAATKFLSRVSRTSAKKHNIDDRGSLVLNHELGKIIGYGSWGIVRECYSLSDKGQAENESSDPNHRLVRAIKIVKTKNEIVRKCFKKEIRIWKLLNHKRLLPLLFVKETDYAIFCITPKIYGGTLFDIVSSWGYYNDPNSPIAISKRLKVIKKFIWEILDGLSYMHYNGIVHGDLKLENCLIDEITNPVTKKIENHILICDFGMSCFYINPSRAKHNSISSARSSLTKLSSAAEGMLYLEKSRPSIPKSVSSENLSVSFNKMHEILFNKTITHDDTPAGISSFPKNYGPAPTSTSLNLTPIQFNYIQNEQPSNDKTPLPHTHIGSLPYASPEILLPNPPPLGPTADIWAFGVLLYTMVVGKLPFQHNFEPRLRAMIARGKYDTECLKFAGGSQPELIEIIKGCLTKDVIERWDLDRIVETLIAGE